MTRGVILCFDRDCGRLRVGIESRLFPTVSHYTGALVTSMVVGDLLYIQDLIDWVGGPAVALAQKCENSSRQAALVAMVWDRFGELGLKRIECEASVMLFDTYTRRLIGLRDPLGCQPLFWTSGARYFALSTSTAPLLDLLPKREIDMEYVADFLACPMQRNEVGAERTIYTGINRIPPGAIATLSTIDGRSSVRRYWDWWEHIEEPSSPHLSDIAEEYREKLRAAVVQRMRRRTFVHFSGGMDSTSIAYLARDAAHCHGPASVQAISLVYTYPILRTERAFIKAARERAGDLTFHEIEADHLLDFQSCCVHSGYDEPYMALWCSQLDAAILRFAASRGCDRMLSGIGADDQHPSLPLHFRDLLRKGCLTSLWRESGVWAQAWDSNRLNLLSQFAFRNPLQVRKPLKVLGFESVPSWIRPSFARAMHLSDRTRGQRSSRPKSNSPQFLRHAIAALHCLAGDPVRWTLAEPFGTSISHPFLDVRAVSYALGSSLKIVADPRTAKPLLGAAMSDILPADIRYRRRKAHFDEIYFLGLRKHQRFLERLIDIAPIDDLHFLDKPKLCLSLRYSSTGAVATKSMQHIDRVVSLLAWFTSARIREVDALCHVASQT
jgi:asparagine synthase (glutamine-hydrolysing)